MRTFIDYFSEMVSFDAERDFYAKVFPDTVGENGMIRIRPMKRTDLKAVFAIEKAVYEFPWSEAVFKDCLNVGYSCWVCENVRDVVGYGIVSVVAGESHIMNICVSPTVQKKGYGRKMLEKLIEVARARNANTMLLEVRPSNLAAISLYEKMGFNQIGTRKDYYPARDGREDALMLALALRAEEQAEEE